jgi:hypothetical protein
MATETGTSHVAPYTVVCGGCGQQHVVQPVYSQVQRDGAQHLLGYQMYCPRIECAIGVVPD